MRNGNKPVLRLALPSKGELERPTLEFFTEAGLGVHKPNQRQYSAYIPSAPQVEVVFQRVTDVFHKVAQGNADLGITGLDVVSEHGEEQEDVIVVENLGFGKCDLVVAVPENWVDISSSTELADLAIAYKEKGKNLRIATKYANLTRSWLYQNGITHFALVEADGALEAAPAMGYADVIADITSSGTTLRENRLKTIRGGTILKSEACLIGNKLALVESTSKLQLTKQILELIEAHLRARKFVSITANIRGESIEALGRRLSQDPKLSGLVGPSITHVFPHIRNENDWYAVTIVVERDIMVDTIEHLRRNQGTDITVTNPSYVFDSKSWLYEKLEELLKREKRK